MKDIVRFFQLPREKIVEFIFLLEGYDGIGIVRTLDREQGIIEVLISPDLEKEFNLLLEKTSPQLNIREIKKPKNVASILDEFEKQKKDPKTAPPKQ